MQSSRREAVASQHCIRIDFCMIQSLSVNATACPCENDVCAMQGVSMDSVASQRALQLGTVQSYIAEAMAAGYGYPWHRMGVPYHLLASLCSHVRTYHKQVEQYREQQAQTHQLPQSGQQQQQLQIHQLECELQQQHHQSQHHHHQSQHHHHHLHHNHQSQQQQQRQRGVRKAQTHTQADNADAVCAVAPTWECKEATAAVAADFGPDEDPTVASTLAQGQTVCSDCELPCDQGALVMDSNGAVQLCVGIRAMGDSPSSKVVQLPDISILKELVQTGKGTKALRDSMDGCDIAYGQLRLALAHLFCLLRHSVCQCT